MKCDSGCQVAEVRLKWIRKVAGAAVRRCGLPSVWGSSLKDALGPEVLPTSSPSFSGAGLTN